MQAAISDPKPFSMPINLKDINFFDHRGDGQIALNGPQDEIFTQGLSHPGALHKETAVCQVIFSSIVDHVLPAARRPA
jgi:hypothetical protein